MSVLTRKHVLHNELGEGFGTITYSFSHEHPSMKHTFDQAYRTSGARPDTVI
jgi:hypothetical protein